MFSAKEALVLLEQTQLNEHAIQLEDGKQPLYRPIYSLLRYTTSKGGKLMNNGLTDLVTDSWSNWMN